MTSYFLFSKVNCSLNFNHKSMYFCMVRVIRYLVSPLLELSLSLLYGSFIVRQFLLFILSYYKSLIVTGVNILITTFAGRYYTLSIANLWSR